MPGRTSIYRCLVRHGLIDPQRRRRKRSDYKRWERSRAMELWQMDIVGGARLEDGTEAKIVTGVDDHSRFCVSALVVARATAVPTCDALALAMRRQAGHPIRLAYSFHELALLAAARPEGQPGGFGHEVTLRQVPSTCRNRKAIGSRGS